jgi:hypothetical protein
MPGDNTAISHAYCPLSFSSFVPIPTLKCIFVGWGSIVWMPTLYSIDALLPGDVFDAEILLLLRRFEPRTALFSITLILILFLNFLVQRLQPIILKANTPSLVSTTINGWNDNASADDHC